MLVELGDEHKARLLGQKVFSLNGLPTVIPDGPTNMRNAGLDVLRFFAVFLVLGNHLELPKAAGPVVEAWQRGGWVGVDLFFVLSGFLISTLLFNEAERTGQLDIKRFLIRRGFKIYPAFYVFLFSTIILMAIESGTAPPKRGLLGEVLFVQNYVGKLWNHTWSLAVEEHFYFAIALVFGIYVRKSATRSFAFIPSLFGLIAGVCLLMRVANDMAHPDYDFYRDLARTHLRVDSLFFGVLIAFCMRIDRFLSWLDKVPSFALVALGCCMLFPAFVYDRVSYSWIVVYGVVLFYLGSGSLLLAAIRYQRASVLTGWIASLGAASYSVYLWHMPINRWGYRALAAIVPVDSWWIYCVIYIVGSCLCGWLANHLLEVPVMRVRDRLFPDTAKMLAEPKKETRGVKTGSMTMENHSS